MSSLKIDVASPIALALPQSSRGGASRLAFVDNVRSTMIILVLSMHACDTYSPFGNWYFTDRSQSSMGTLIVFGVYQSFLQAFFMALLFFLSGYFAPPSLRRKGSGGFARERLVRLGLPTLSYMFVIGPLTQYFLSHTWGRGGFPRQWLTHLRDGQWLSESGPMWFCATLLMLSLALALLWPCRDETFQQPRLQNRGIFVFIVIMAAATFAIRIFIPEDVSHLNMHFGDFPQYILMFSAGALAYRGRWIERCATRTALTWLIACLGVAIPLFAALIIGGGALRGVTAPYNGGMNLVSAGKCLWESLVCVGMTMGLLGLYRTWFNRKGRLATLLSDNAFSVYLFHPPILIGIALSLRDVHLPALAKAATLTALAAIATFAISQLLLRRVPVLRRIL